MNLFDTIAVLLGLAALCSYLNHRILRLHGGAGVMIVSLALSLGLLVLQAAGVEIHQRIFQFLSGIQFGPAILNWMLGFLLFAGALTLDLEELNRQRGIIAALSVIGTIISMFTVAVVIWAALHALGTTMDWMYCLLLGALISPTDPIAVLQLIKRMGGLRRMQTIIGGESLFNDGVGVVLFLTLLDVVRIGHPVSTPTIVLLFLRECGGGIILGLVGGIIVYWIMKRVHDFGLEVLLTLSLVMGIFSIAQRLGVSGPIAEVAAGLLVGNRGGVLKMPADVVQNLDQFWAMVDEILNTVLFMLMGLEVLVTPMSVKHLMAAAIGIPAVLYARWISVSLIMMPLQPRGPARSVMVRILTWGGLRGGLAIAMALSIPDDPHHNRERIVAITYGVVAFSILVQSTTMQRVLARNSAYL